MGEASTSGESDRRIPSGVGFREWYPLTEGAADPLTSVYVPIESVVIRSSTDVSASSLRILWYFWSSKSVSSSFYFISLIGFWLLLNCFGISVKILLSFVVISSTWTVFCFRSLLVYLRYILLRVNSLLFSERAKLKPSAACLARSLSTRA